MYAVSHSFGVWGWVTSSRVTGPPLVTWVPSYNSSAAAEPSGAPYLHLGRRPRLGELL